jgi:hypothetical protein
VEGLPRSIVTVKAFSDGSPLSVLYQTSDGIPTRFNRGQAVGPSNQSCQTIGGAIPFCHHSAAVSVPPAQFVIGRARAGRVMYPGC